MNRKSNIETFQPQPCKMFASFLQRNICTTTIRGSHVLVFLLIILVVAINVLISYTRQSNGIFEIINHHPERITHEPLQAKMPHGRSLTSFNSSTVALSYQAGHINDLETFSRICPHSGAEVRLLILITSSPDHQDHRMAIRQTWAHYGARRDIAIGFMLGRSLVEQLDAFTQAESQLYSDMITGNFVDSYNNLTLKTVSMLEWFGAHCPLASYLLKTDDDMFINVPELLRFIDDHAADTRSIYGRLAMRWPPIRDETSKYYVSPEEFAPATFPPFTTGPAYLITADIIQELYTTALKMRFLKLEDVFLTGIVADKLEIPRKGATQFANERKTLSACNIRKTISMHKIKPDEQFEMWQKLLDKRIVC